MRLFRKRRSQADFVEEILAHIDLETDRLVATGMDPATARRQAMIMFGNVTNVTETRYESGRLLWLEHVARDIRYACRGLMRSPTFTLAAVTTLAFGIGVNTSLFSLIYGLAARPLPLPEPSRLVNIYQTFEGRSTRYIAGTINLLAYDEYLAYQNRGASLSGLAAYSEASVSVNDESVSEAHAQLVTCNFRDVLRFGMALGRSLTSDDCLRSSSPVAIVSHAYWKSHFAGEPSVIGQTVSIEGVPVTLVGVAAAGFGGIEMQSADMWLPITLEPAIAGRESLLGQRNISWLKAIGRLRDGVSAHAARENLLTVARALDSEYPGRHTNVLVSRAAYINGPEERETGRFLVIGATGLAVLALLMACTNVMNLMLARAGTKKREISTRLALGAGSRRVLLQLLAESGVLSLLGAAGGLMICYWLPGAIMRALHADGTDLSPDFRVFGFTMFASALTTVAFGLLPALDLLRVDIAASLRANEGARSGSRGGKTRSAVVFLQVAASAFLLATAGLVLHATYKAQVVNPGFRTADIHVLTVRFPSSTIDEASAAAYYDEIEQRLRGLNGVKSVARARVLPLLTKTTLQVVPTAGKARRDPITTGANEVSTAYFQALDIRIVRGRAFTKEDARAGYTPAVISASLATQLSPDADPIGATFTSGNTAYSVVGVAQDARNLSLSREDGAFFYAAANERNPRGMLLLLRTTPSFDLSAQAINSVAATVDPDVRVNATSFESSLSRLLAPIRLSATMLAILSSISAFLAVIGVYGIIVYTIGQRATELAIRTALGATPAMIRRHVVNRGALLVIGGLLAGALGALALGQAMKVALYGVNPLQSAAVPVAIFTLGMASLIAMHIPLVKVLRSPPGRALRNDA